MSLYYCDLCDTKHNNDHTPCFVVFGALRIGNPQLLDMPIRCEESHEELYPPMRTIVGATVPGSRGMKGAPRTQ
jgi:hypothetical protein